MDNIKQVNIGPAFRWGWETLKKDFWYFIILVLLVAIIPSLVSGADSKNASLNIISLALSTWMTCGITKILIDYYRGNKREITDLFTQYKYFWKVLLANIFLGIIVMVGLIFFIIPGIYLALKYSFTIYYIVDKNMDVLEAMKKSSELTEGIKMDLFLFGLAIFGTILLGVIALGIGIFVAIPIVYLAGTYIYMNLIGEKSKEATPATTPEMPTPPENK